MNKVLYRLIDLTSLTGDETAHDIAQLCHQASDDQLGHVAAICVYPNAIKWVKQYAPTSRIKIATVLQFPGGNEDNTILSRAVTHAIDEGADELDMVFNYNAYQKGNTQLAIEQVKMVRHMAPYLKLKVILETGMFTDMQLLSQAATEVIASGADFLKTSTGKAPIGATLAAATCLLDAIANSKQQQVGLKVSGGIRTPQQALAYYRLAQNYYSQLDSDYFRIGASALVTELLAYR